MRTQAVSSSPRAHSILLTCRCTSSVREARKPLRDNNHGQTASHLCQEFWILVYGVTGSGKSTAAQRIAARTGLPPTLADELTWAPGWVPVAEDEQRRRMAAVVAQDRWVLDTAYGAWLDFVLPRVDLVVGLDYPRWFSLQRVFRRSVMRAIDKKPICNGNTESFRAMLGRDSIIGWHFRSFGRKRGRMRTWAAAAEGPAVLLFTRSRDLEIWIDTLGDSAANGTNAPGVEAAATDAGAS
jgi:adenylate kinase family enzyme